MRMAHGSLREFDPIKESIEDFKERFEFYCLANNFRGEGNHAQCKKALFITLIGQETYAKLKILTSPSPVANLTLDAIMEHLIGHYRPQTTKIAECFKFFKPKRRVKASLSLWQNYSDWQRRAILGII